MFQFSQGTSSAFTRLMLAITASVTLMQTPLPMLHCHDEIETATGLEGHLERKHRGDTVLSSDLHWHLVRPSEYGHEHEGDSPSPSDDRPPASTALSGAHAGLAAAASTGDTWLEPSPLEKTLAASGGVADSRVELPSGPNLFAGGLASARARSCAFLCVIRC